MAGNEQRPLREDPAVYTALALSVPQVDPPAELRARVLSEIVGTSPKLGPDTKVRLKPDTTGAFTYLALAASLVIVVALGFYVRELRLQHLNDRTRIAVLAAPDLKRLDLAGQPAAPSAFARAFWSRANGLVFQASNLPPLPPGRVYQLWVLTAQPAPISAGLLKPDPSGGVNAVFNTPPDLPAPVAMAVTIEPDGGVPAPTGDKYLVGIASGP